MKENSPFSKIGYNTFFRQYKDLISVSAEISNYERTIIEHSYELMWFYDFKIYDKQNVEKTAISANHFLVQGTHKSHQDVAVQYIKSTSNLIFELNSVLSKRSKTKFESGINLDDLVENLLILYKTMYERLVPIIVAPIVYGFKLSQNLKDKVYIPGEDGRVSLKALKKMESLLIHPQNRLARGLNSHIRNSYSHDHYRILDFGKVELWDVNPRTKETNWGPEIFDFQDLEKLCHKLWVNSIGIIIGLMVFGVNNRKIIRERNWWPKNLPIKKLRISELNQAANSLAKQRSFFLENLTQKDNEITIELRTEPKGIDQDEEIFVGRSSSNRFYKVPVKYIETLVIHEVLMFVHGLLKLAQETTKFDILVFDFNKEVIGSAVITANDLESLITSEIESFNNVATNLKTNTIKNKIMYFKYESDPIFVGSSKTHNKGH